MEPPPCTQREYIIGLIQHSEGAPVPSVAFVSFVPMQVHSHFLRCNSEKLGMGLETRLCFWKTKCAHSDCITLGAYCTFARPNWHIECTENSQFRIVSLSIIFLVYIHMYIIREEYRA